MLADQVACPGLVEGLAALAALVFDDTGIGSIVAVFNGIATTGAVLLFAALALRATGDRLATIIAGLAMLTAQVTPETIGLDGAAALAVAAVAWLAAPWSRLPGSSRPIGLTVALGAAAALAPPLTAPLAIVGLTLAGGVPHLSRSTRPASLARLAPVVFVLAAGGGAAVLVPPLSGEPASMCLVPWATGASASTAAAAVGRLAGQISPALVALAALGAFVCWRQPARNSGPFAPGNLIPTLTLGGVPLLAATSPLADPARTLAIPAVACWLLAARGLSDLFGRAVRPWGRTGVVTFAAAIPVLHLAAPAAPADPADRPAGHGSVTLNALAAVAGLAPPGARFVQEGALTDVVWRAASWRGDVPAGQSFVPGRAASVRQALGEGPVLAMPRAERHLQPRGFRTQPWREAGFAEVTSVEPCVVVDRTWRDGSMAAGADGLALIAPEPATRGPVIVYFRGDEPLRLYARDWPRGVERGFDVLAYDRERPDDRERLSADATADNLPAGWPGERRFVSRLEVWRIPGAPLALPVVVEGIAAGSVIRTAANADPAFPPQICPSFVQPVVPFDGE